MKRNESLQRKIEETWQEQVDTLQEIIAIDSVQGEPKEGKPFGEGVHCVYRTFLKKGEDLGFISSDFEGYGGHLEYGQGEEEELIGIACYLDTVPLGSDWDKDPLGGEIEEGKLYGRGAMDDKGPAVAALYAMKANLEMGYIPRGKVRLILGLDEETNWNGMEYYLEQAEEPTIGFTPDAVFPIIHGEKGILVFDLDKKFKVAEQEGLELRKLEGGFAANMVADGARAVIFSKNRDRYDEVKEMALQWKKEKNIDIKTKGIGKSMEINISGVSAHGARPELGTNAISLMIQFLIAFSFNNEDVNEFLHFYHSHIEHEYNGEKLGCGFSDSLSGETVLNVGMIKLDRKSVELTINIRYPISIKGEEVYESLSPICNEYNLGIVKKKHQPPIYMSKDHPLVKTLMETYVDCTGDKTSEPLVIGGGTYARAFENMVAFGASFPSEEDLAHQKNEYINLDSFRLMTEIYAEAIYRLTQ